MQKQVLFKRVHAFLGRGITVAYITGQSLVAGKSTQKHYNATCRAFIFSAGLWWDGETHWQKEKQPFQEKLFDKQKKVGVQSAGPAQMGGYAEKRRIIKYEWEWAVLTCKLQASVCHHYWEDGKGERWLLPHTEVQTRPIGLVHVIDLVIGVGGGGWCWKKGTSPDPDIKRACLTLIKKRTLIRHKQMEQMKGYANSPPPPSSHREGIVLHKQRTTGVRV